MKLKLFFSVFVIISILLTGAAFANTLILQPGSSDGIDTYLGWSDSPSFLTGTHGSEGNIYVSDRPFLGRYGVGLIQFDLPSTLTGAVITSATMGLYLCDTYKEYSDTAIDVFRVTSSWNESTVQYPNIPTYDSSSPLASFIPKNYVTTSIGMGGNTPYWVEIDITEALKKWVNGDWDNYGMLLDVNGSGTSALFYSSDFGTASLRPKLEVNYSSSTTPIPGAVWLLGSGLFGLIGLKKKFKD